MVVVSRLTPKRVGFGVFVRALAVDVLIFVFRTSHHLGITGAIGDLTSWAAAGLTAAVGFWLGRRRRTGTALAAPWLSWMLLVPFAFISEFIRRGFFSGLWWGFLFSVFGGFVASTIEVGVLFVFALLGRVALGSAGGRGRTVILPPRTG